jgi:hypothetical protein
MSSAIVFEVLHEVCKRLDDDFIDEDMSEIDMGRHQVTNRSITVRGRHRGRAVVLQYADYWSEAISPLLPPVYERNILEVFVAQPRVSFEGTCRARGAMDKVGRWFGRGGLKGEHRVFESTRIDPTEPSSTACLVHPAFGDALERIATSDHCRRVKLQAGSGVGLFLGWQHLSSQDVIGWVDRMHLLAATLD